MKIARAAWVALLGVSLVVAGFLATGNGPPAGGADTKAEQNSVVLTIVSASAKESFPANHFVQDVAQASGGAIRLKFDDIATPDDDDAHYATRTIAFVAQGKADLGVVPASAFEAAGVKSFRGLLAPFLIDSYGLEEEVLPSAWAQALLGETRAAGVVGLGYTQGILERPLGLTHALLDPSDFAGARVGIQESPTSQKTLEALGAVPVVYPPSDARGLDGLAIHMPQILMKAFDDQAYAFTGNVAFWPDIGVVFANARRFDRLRPELQAMLRTAARNNLQWSIEGRVAFMDQAVGVACTNGFVIRAATDAARRALQDLVQPVYDELEQDSLTRKTIRSVEELRASTTPDAIACSASQPSALPSSDIESFIVGTWETSFPQEEYRSISLTQDFGESLDDTAWGNLTLTLRNDGSMWQERRNPLGQVSGPGVYALDGDRIQMWFEGEGEMYEARWSLFRDTLTFERPEGARLPTYFLIRAWARVR